MSCSWLTPRRRKCFVWYLSVRRTVASLPSLISQRPRSAFPATRTREKENVCAARDIRVTGRFQSHSSWSKLIGSNWLLNISVCLATQNCARCTLYNGYAPRHLKKKNMTVLWQSLNVAFSQHLSCILISFHVFKRLAYDSAVEASCKMIGLCNVQFFLSAISQQRNYYISLWHFKAKDLSLKTTIACNSRILHFLYFRPEQNVFFELNGVFRRTERKK